MHSSSSEVEAAAAAAAEGEGEDTNGPPGDKERNNNPGIVVEKTPGPDIDSDVRSPP